MTYWKGKHLMTEDIFKGRNYMVVKSNAVIQRSRYELSVVEQRTIAYICSLIKPASDGEYQFNIREYANICGIEADGRMYDTVKKTLKGLRDKSMWLILENGSETTVGWLDRVTTNKRSGRVIVRIDDRFAPYLFDLKEKFTEYGLYNVLKIKSQYSIRLFELLKSYAYIEYKLFDIDELKRLLMVDNVKSYNNFKDFRNRVLDVAVKEINELTDLNVTYETINMGRKVVQISFAIKQKTPIESILTKKRKMG